MFDYAALMNPMEKSRHPVARLRGDGEERLLYPDTTLRIGRSRENDIVFNDPKVSRMHAELVWQASVFTLRDLGSVNGTFVNGERLSESSRVLRDGDDIILGKQRLVYEMLRIEQTEPLQDRGEITSSARSFITQGAYLVVFAGPDMGQQFPLWGEMITIGRASREATWEIRLTDRSVSRPHARLERSPETVVLIDLHSANGTLLNGVPVKEPAPVKDGDMISVGETQLIYHAGRK